MVTGEARANDAGGTLRPHRPYQTPSALLPITGLSRGRVSESGRVTWQGLANLEQEPVAHS